MFSIAAINDTDSQGQWEPLAPTKEAQEFHLSQNYHEGLLKLQAKEYNKARELFESVLKDPIIVGALVDSSASNGHLSQLRYLALKNLASVFLQQGSNHYESALQCYLQAVEIDSKDSVLWNQLGTLSCSMGLLSISRWAFEQGLLCSPNNWNCMEKLLEVLIAIGDEVACLSVAELILRHWPSHSRALHVKKTIEDSEPIPFAPRGIDRLEPKHARLKFLDKRKTREKSPDENSPSKRAKQSIEVRLDEASWGALVSGILAVLLPMRECSSKVVPERAYRSGDIRLDIQLPSDLDKVLILEEERGMHESGDDISNCDNNTDRSNTLKNKDADYLEEQKQERRSTRIERLRSRKPGKEESDYEGGKDMVKVAFQSLEPYIVGGIGISDLHNYSGSSISCPDQTSTSKPECTDVVKFVKETSKNYGAYHIGHLLLEYVATRDLFYQDVELLELERLTRQWGKDRSPECSLFLAELYYDLGSYNTMESEVSKCMSEASYHLCKVIESVALEYPHLPSPGPGNTHSSSFGNLQGPRDKSHADSMCLDFPGSSFVRNKTSFWVRFFWLSGQLSIFDGNKAKAYEEFCISLSHWIKQDNVNNLSLSIQLPYCKVIKELTVDRIVYEINSLKVDSLLEKTISMMIEEEMYSECINLLAPLIFSTKDVYLDTLPVCVGIQKGQEFMYRELSALDILIKACSMSVPVDYEVYLNCHRRKLQILIVAAGMDSCIVSNGSRFGNPSLRASSTPKTELKDWNLLITEEIKAISHCVSEVKNFMDHSDESDLMMGLTEIIGNVQSLLLTVMCNIRSITSGQVINDPDEIKQLCFFVDAAVSFCKLQHLIPSISIKDQVELIVAVHDLLAEHGLCCAGGDKAGEEGTFLKFAIKHLLALDAKLKSKTNSFNLEAAESEEHSYSNIQDLSSKNASKSDVMNETIDLNKADQANSVENNISIEKSSPGLSSALDTDNAAVDSKSNSDHDSKSLIHNGERTIHHLSAEGTHLSEDGVEELESKIDTGLDQCFFCLYGLNLRSDSSYDDDLAVHRNTSRGDYQTKEQCADVFQYILPSAKASSKTGLLKLRKVLRAIRKHFPGPPEDVLAGNVIDKYLDDPGLCEDKLSEDGGSDGFLETIMKSMFPDGVSLKHYKASLSRSSEPYSEIYHNLYYLLAQAEETSATDKWPGFVLTKEGEELVQQNANLYKYDLMYNPLRYESWQQLANIYDEEVDLLLNDGSKHINVAAWRKNANLSERVDISRRRSRRCLLMSLALSKTSSQQREIHELLALVYYDSLQNVVPFYDQRSVVSSKDAAWVMFCENSMRHFKKAFANKQDWSHAFYMGKLSEKLKYPHDKSLSYFDKAISLNPSAVDPIYRMHASRLKKLWTCGKQDLEMLKTVAAYSFSNLTKDAVLDIFSKLGSEIPSPQGDGSRQVDLENVKQIESLKMQEAWHLLYRDCLSALEVCVEGDLKHFHKARYMLAQGLYRRREKGDLERAKEELSFCFKSSRSCFTINMWEIDGMVKKGRRSAGNKKTLEVSLPESSRKFITCIRKYVLFYLKLLEETGDICTLERAYVSLRADKRFSLCMEDLVPLAIARYIKALVSSLCQAGADISTASSSYEHLLEKLFNLFMEQGTFWPEICSMAEIKTSETSESRLYSYLHEHIGLLERNGKLEVLEVINEKMRRRFKNPKLSNSSCAKVCRHVLTAWCRSLITALASVTPLQPAVTSATSVPNLRVEGSETSQLFYVDLQTCPGVSENIQLLYVDLQTNELWNSGFEETSLLKSLQTKWSPILSNIKSVLLRRASDENLETVNSLLRSSYNFYRESSCVMLPCAINLYLVPSHIANEACFRPGMEGMEILDLSLPRKLLLWSYALLHGRYANISAVVKYCEENAKSKLKRGSVTSSTPSNTVISVATPAHAVLSDGKDGAKNAVGSEADITPVQASALTGEGTGCLNLQPTNGDGQRSLHSVPQLHHCNNAAERSESMAQGGD